MKEFWGKPQPGHAHNRCLVTRVHSSGHAVISWVGGTGWAYTPAAGLGTEAGATFFLDN